MFLWYPKCSTCKEIKKELEKEGFSFTLRDIKEENPTKEELLAWTTEDTIKKFFNTSGLIYKKLKLKEKMDCLSYMDKIELLASDGMLIKRPILCIQDKVLVGRKEIYTIMKKGK